jgi:hypothetical protein
MSVTRSAKPLPTTFITKDVVNERVCNFLSGKHIALSEALGREDTRAGWYSLEQLEELVREMHYQDADGLRIYFGAYSDSDLTYPGQLTVIFVPTFLDETTNLHTDIIIEDLPDFEDRSASAMLSSSKYLDSIGLCPPSCLGHTLSYPTVPCSTSYPVTPPTI